MTPEEQFGAGKEAEGHWASCVQLVDAKACAVTHTLEIEGNEAALTACSASFSKLPGVSVVVVCTAASLSFYPREASGGFIHLYKVRGWRGREGWASDALSCGAGVDAGLGSVKCQTAPCFRTQHCVSASGCARRCWRAAGAWRCCTRRPSMVSPPPCSPSKTSCWWPWATSCASTIWARRSCCASASSGDASARHGQPPPLSAATPSGRMGAAPGQNAVGLLKR